MWAIHEEHHVRNPLGISNYKYLQYHGYLLAVIDEFERKFKL